MSAVKESVCILLCIHNKKVLTECSYLDIICHFTEQKDLQTIGVKLIAN